MPTLDHTLPTNTSDERGELVVSGRLAARVADRMFKWYIERHPKLREDAYSSIRFVNKLVAHMYRQKPTEPSREDIEDKAVHLVLVSFLPPPETACKWLYPIIDAGNREIASEVRKLIRAHDSRFT